MGDTFPRSFSTMDLRLAQTQSPRLATTIQELGRLCRYVPWIDKVTEDCLPSVLVGNTLYNRLQTVSFAPDPISNMRFSIPADGMIPKKGNQNRKSLALIRQQFDADKVHYVFENCKQYRNRFLLQAEPQVGKTGAYLYLIKLLILEFEHRYLHELDDLGPLLDTNAAVDVEANLLDNAEADYPELNAILQLPALADPKHSLVIVIIDGVFIVVLLLLLLVVIDIVFIVVFFIFVVMELVSIMHYLVESLHTLVLV
jgi:hypothetical protein